MQAPHVYMSWRGLRYRGIIGANKHELIKFNDVIDRGIIKGTSQLVVHCQANALTGSTCNCKSVCATEYWWMVREGTGGRSIRPKSDN